MKKFAFISRHTPTADQVELASELGIELVHIGDRDAFTFDFSSLATPHPMRGRGAWRSDDPEVTRLIAQWDADRFHGVIVVHPLAALRAIPFFRVGVFENANRAKEGQPPQFVAKSLRIFVQDTHEEVGVHEVTFTFGHLPDELDDATLDRVDAENAARQDAYQASIASKAMGDAICGQ